VIPWQTWCRVRRRLIMKYVESQRVLTSWRSCTTGRLIHSLSLVKDWFSLPLWMVWRKLDRRWPEAWRARTHSLPSSIGSRCTALRYAVLLIGCWSALNHWAATLVKSASVYLLMVWCTQICMMWGKQQIRRSSGSNINSRLSNKSCASFYMAVSLFEALSRVKWFWELACTGN